jgi:hypothetical protein
MAGTLNTMPFYVQRELLGRDWHECVSQRDLRMVSNYRKVENRRTRAQTKQALRQERYDDLPTHSTARGSALWLAY